MAREGIEPPTRGFSAASRGFQGFINQSLASACQPLLRHTTAQLRHTKSELGTLASQSHRPPAKEVANWRPTSGSPTAIYRPQAAREVRARLPLNYGRGVTVPRTALRTEPSMLLNIDESDTRPGLATLYLRPPTGMSNRRTPVGPSWLKCRTRLAIGGVQRRHSGSPGRLPQQRLRRRTSHALSQDISHTNARGQATGALQPSGLHSAIEVGSKSSNVRKRLAALASGGGPRVQCKAESRRQTKCGKGCGRGQKQKVDQSPFQGHPYRSWKTGRKGGSTA